MYRSVILVSASLLAIGPCSKKDDAADAATTAATTTAATATTTAEAPKPPPPADAATACSATPTKVMEQSGDTVVAFTLKNTGKEPWHYCNVYAWAYDKSGAVIARGGISDNGELAPGAERSSSIRLKDSKDKPLPLAAAQTANYELLASDIAFDDKSRWEDKNLSLYGQTKPRGTALPIGAKPAGKK